MVEHHVSVVKFAVDMYRFSVILNAFWLAMVLSFATWVMIPLAHADTDTSLKTKVVFSQALKLLKKRQFNSAIKKLTRVINQKPVDDNLQGVAYYNRGLASQALGKLDVARADYSSAINLKTLNDKVLKVVYYNRGLVHDGLKRPQAALADFTSAIEKNPKFAPAYHNRGNVLRKLGRPEQAIGDFIKSLKLGNPQPYLTYLGLAMSYERLNRNKAAITSLKYALRLRPRFKEASDMLARLTTADLYTFPTKTASINDDSPIATSSISKATLTSNPARKSRRVISEFARPNPNQNPDLGLRGVAKVEKQPVQYKKLTLRGTLTDPASGRVAIVVPGPGLKKAQKSKRPKTLPKKRVVRGNFKVQLGTSRTSSRANKVWFFLRAQHEDLLENLKPTFQKVKIDGGGILYRIQVGPFKSWRAAQRMCEAIKQRAVNCFPVSGNG